MIEGIFGIYRRWCEVFFFLFIFISPGEGRGELELGN